MTAIIIDGKKLSEKKKEYIKKETQRLHADNGMVPCLATILVGEDPGSQVYIKNKIKSCELVGMRSLHHTLKATASQAELLKLINELNREKTVHGILVQLPLPREFDTHRVINAIAPEKDVDCFHPHNTGNFFSAKTWKQMEELTFLPCTPAGIMELLKEYNIPVAGKQAVVLGRSNIVGKPIGLMLLAQDATVSFCHSKTHDLLDSTRKADIIIAAIGKENFLKGEFIKPGAVVIDVGMNRSANGLIGDVDFASAAPKASYITPVPGGVGPMTIVMLLVNTLRAAQRDRQVR